MKIYTTLTLLISIFLFGCSPIYRHNKIVEKYPFVHTQDTVVLKDTIKIKVPEIKHDTIFSRHFFTEIRKDTLIIQKERLSIKIYHDTIKDSIFVRGKCDTITKTKVVERKVPIRYYKVESSWLKYVIICAVLLLLSMSFCSYIRKCKAENK